MTKLASTIDPHGIAASMPLRADIRSIIIDHKPYNILETGTYNGLGSTSAILHGLEDAGVDGFSLISIESNRRNHSEAVKNIGGEQYKGTVLLMYANSLPERMMPKMVYEVPDHVITDHADPMKYLKEVPEDIDDDGIYRAMALLDNRPDLVLLDSAGHLGFLEFEYVCKLAEKGFILILDDTLHRKHYDTLEFIKAHPEDFNILKESKDKFGHAIIWVHG